MRECWINVYPGFDVNGGHYCGPACHSAGGADVSAIGVRDAITFRRVREIGRALRAAGVGYRLHVRLKPEPAPPPQTWHAERLAALMGERQ